MAQRVEQIKGASINFLKAYFHMYYITNNITGLLNYDKQGIESYFFRP